MMEMHMSYVVYNTQTTRIVSSRNTKHWKSAGAAKAHLTRMGKMGYNVGEHAVAETNYFYDNIEKSVTKTNLMTGKEYQESVNTPISCSLASETYWSM
jgi:hypothetical protein